MMGSPNIIAFLALFAWVPVTIVLYWRLRPQLATMVSMFGGIMFLPEQTSIDPPLLPPFDKLSVTAMWAFLCCLWKAPELIRAAKPFRGIDLLFVLVIIGNIGTSVTNPDPLVTGQIVRPELSLYDAFALGVKDVLSLYLPFLLARAMLKTPRDLAELFRVLGWAGLTYGLLAIVEKVMSPQLHRWIYGFHQMDFSMTMRFGGYRPMIFMLTGLATAMFVLITAMAAIARVRAGGIPGSQRLQYLGLSAFLSVMLFVCVSTGAIIYGVFVLPIVALVKKPRLWLATGLALMVLLFPLLRGLDLFPTDQLVEWAEKISEERALSLWFRFDQEDQLLERARERLWFGWGTYNRNRLFDPETGEDLSITDGDWMIQLGCRGLVGFIGLYGLLAVSVVVAQRRIKHVKLQRDRILLGALGLMSALLTVELLPNGLFHSLPFFFAGATFGLTTGIAAASRKQEKAARAARTEAARERRRRRTQTPLGEHEAVSA
jgi:hypothetical protein